MAEKKTKPAVRAKLKPRRPTRVGKASKPTERVHASLRSSVPMLSIPRRLWKIGLGVIVAILVILLGYFGYTKVYAAPSRVFWSMVDNNLTTVGVTRETSQPTCLPVNAQLTNTIQYTFSPKLTVRCLTHVNNGSANLTIESLGTTTADYERYSKIETPGKQKNYDKIYTLWLKNNGSDANGPRLYGQLLNGPLLFGYLNGPEKTRLIGDLKQVYAIDYNAVQKQRFNGRQIYTYPVTISLRKYAFAEKSYADALGLPNANRINPASYPVNSKVKLSFAVDVLSRQLRAVGLSGSTEQYSGYGVKGDTTLPAKTVSDQVLQNAFSQATK